jgi:hypothetical protein
MQQRLHFEQSDIEQRSAHEAMRLRKLADALGIKREWLLERARRCETGSHVSELPRSPELRPPK